MTITELLLLIPDIAIIEKIKVDKTTCDNSGFKREFWNEYERVKKELDVIFWDSGIKPSIANHQNYDIAISYFLDWADDEYKQLKSKNLL